MAIEYHNQTTTRKRAPGVKLTRHSKGWVAKIGGKVRWLAPLHKPQLAMERYHQKRKDFLDSIHAAKPVTIENASLGQLGDLFLGAREANVKAGELKPRTLADYRAGIQSAIDYFGYDVIVLNIPIKRWQEYRSTLAEKHDVFSLARYVGAIRGLSKWAHENEYIDRPFRFGSEFKRPSQKLLRTVRHASGKRVWSPQQVRTFVRAADPVTRAAFLLMLNGGIGNTDIAAATQDSVASETFVRSKTGAVRRFPLWHETTRAIKQAWKVRPAPADPQFANRLFLTKRGYPVVRDQFDGDGNLTSTTDALGMAFTAIAQGRYAGKGKPRVDGLGIDRTLYDARRTFQTIGDEVGPAHVVKAIMGHEARTDDMSAVYRQDIPQAQIVKVINHVRKRLSVAGMTWKAPGDSSDETAKAAPLPRGDVARKPRPRKARTAT